MGRILKKWDIWLIGHVRSVEDFVTAAYASEFLFVFYLFEFRVGIVSMSEI